MCFKILSFLTNYFVKADIPCTYKCLKFTPMDSEKLADRLQISINKMRSMIDEWMPLEIKNSSSDTKSNESLDLLKKVGRPPR